MRNIICSILITGLSVQIGLGQTTCCKAKEACGPGNTKVSEAKILTSLKKELADLQTLAIQANISTQEMPLGHQTLKDLPLDIQDNHEDATLLTVLLEVESLKLSINQQVPALPHFKNKAQLVAALRRDVRQLKEKLSIQ